MSFIPLDHVIVADRPVNTWIVVVAVLAASSPLGIENLAMAPVIRAPFLVRIVIEGGLGLVVFGLLFDTSQLRELLRWLLVPLLLVLRRSAAASIGS